MNARLARLALCGVAWGSGGCRSDKPETAQPSPSTSTFAPTISAPMLSASSAPAEPNGPLADKLSGFRQKLPPPATRSEGNGVSHSCPRHGSVTYGLLYSAASKLPVTQDTDLLTLAHFARDPDDCVRYIAIEAIMKRIGYDSNRTAVPSVHDVEHYEYHDVLGALVSYLDGHRVAYRRELFAGSMLHVTERDFEPLLRGHWHEDVGERQNFQTLVELDGKLLRVTSRKTRDDPKWPARTNTVQVEKVTLNPQRQLVIVGAWRQSSSANGDLGRKIEPADITYSLWPVSQNVVWFREGSGYWKKLVRGRAAEVRRAPEP